MAEVQYFLLAGGQGVGRAEWEVMRPERYAGPIGKGLLVLDSGELRLFLKAEGRIEAFFIFNILY